MKVLVDGDVLDAETEALYWDLSPESRAAIDARWGPPSSSGGPQAQTRAASNQDKLSATTTPSTTRELRVIAAPGIDDSDDKSGPKKQRGTGRVFPTRFTPPSSTITPTQLFPGQATYARLTRVR